MSHCFSQIEIYYVISVETASKWTVSHFIPVFIAGLLKHLFHNRLNM